MPARARVVYPQGGPFGPVIVTGSLPEGAIFTPYNFAMAEAKGTPPLSWSASGLPPGLGISTIGGTITGQPTLNGTYVVSFTVQDALGLSGMAALPVIIDNTVHITTTSPLPAGTVGVAYSASVAAAGGSGTFTWAILSGQDSSGFPTINPVTGALSGTPSSVETLSLVIQATDSASNPSPPTSFTLTVTQTVGAFNFFVHPTAGDDNNPGTINAPWSITAIANNRAQYQGLRIGLLAGTHTTGTKAGVASTLFALCQAMVGGSLALPLPVEGGPGATPTYIASCDSSGNYKARAATISCFDPATGNPVTTECGLLGQSDNNSPATRPVNWGNFVIDGVRMTGWKDAGVTFTNQANVFTTWYPGVKVVNCEFFTNSPAFQNVNPGAVHLLGTLNALVQNNLFYNLTSTTASTFHPFGCPAVQAIGANPGVKVKNNTAYNCGWCYSLKDFGLLTGVGGTVLQPFPFGGVEFSYNYADNGQFGVGGSGLDSMFQMIADTGTTTQCHHNIIVGLVGVIGAGAGVYNRGNVVITNNTLYATVATATHLRNQSDQNFSPLMTFQNNIVWNPTGVYGNGFGGITFNYANNASYNDLGVTGASMNNNYYNVNMRIGDRHNNPNMNPTQWTNLGFDLGSVFSATSPFTGTPAVNADFSPIMSSWATGSQAIIGGKMCGALDGTGPVGCNFTAAAPLTITTASLPAGQTQQTYAQQLGASGGVPATEPTSIFAQPNITNGIGPNFTVAPIQGTPGVGWFMAAWQPSAYGNGLLVPTSIDVSALTGFAPVNPATAQMSSHNVAGSTTAQMEGTTCGAYINTVDIQNTNNKMMIEPEFDFTTAGCPYPFAGSDPLTIALNLQVPTATGVVGHAPPVYTLLDLRFIDPNGVRISIGVKLFRMGGDTATGTNFDAPSNSFLLNWAPGFETRFATLSPGTNNQQSTTWTGYKAFGWSMTAAQFQTAINVLLAAFPGNITTTNPALWRLARIHLNAEIQIQGAGPFSLGWSMNGLTVNGDTAQYSWAQTGGTLPAGLTLYNSGLIAGTPTATGSFNPVFKVTDSASNTATATLPLTVTSGAAALKITNTALGNATVGQLNSYQIAATGGTGGPYVFSLVSVIPNSQLAWTITPLGVLQGTPQAEETSTVIVQVFDGANTAQATLSLQSVCVGPLQIVTSGIPAATSGGMLAFQCLAQGGHPPYFWTCSIQTPVQMDPQGLLHGVLTASSPAFTISVQDSTGTLVTSPSMSVAVDTTLRIAQIDYVDGVLRLPAGYASTHYGTPTVQAFGGVGALSFAATGLPAGLTMAATGNITGIPTNPGAASGTVTVTDSATPTPNTASATFLMNVFSRNRVARPSYNTGTGPFVDPFGLLRDSNGDPLTMRGWNRDKFDQAPTGMPLTHPSACKDGTFKIDGSVAIASYTNDMVNNLLNFNNLPLYPIFQNALNNNVTSGSASTAELASCVNYWCVNFATYMSAVGPNWVPGVANEWGPAGKGASAAWLNAHLPVINGTITSIVGNLITLSGVTGTTNPYAACPFAWIQGVPGVGNQMVNISSTGALSGGSCTVTASTSIGSSTGSGGQLGGGSIGAMRVRGWTTPIKIDAGNFGQSPADLLNFAAQIQAADPQHNVIFDLHMYQYFTNANVLVSSVTTGATTTLHLNSSLATHPFSNPLAAFNPGVSITLQGMAGGTWPTVNGQTFNVTTYGGAPGAWTLVIPLNSTGLGTYTAGSGRALDSYNFTVLSQTFAAMAKASGVCVYYGEIGHYNDPNKTCISYFDVIQGAEANGIGWCYWAWDDNTPTNPGLFGFAMIAATPPPHYTGPGSLAPSGQGPVMHPRMSCNVLATVAPMFV